MAMVFNIGQMEHIMKASGILIKQKVRALSGMLKEMCIEGNLRMIWPMDMENILTLMAVNIKGSLRMMFRKDMEKKNGLMELNMLGHIKME